MYDIVCLSACVSVYLCVRAGDSACVCVSARVCVGELVRVS